MAGRKKKCEGCTLYRRNPYHEDGRCLGCLKEHTNTCETCVYGKENTHWPDGGHYWCLREYDENNIGRGLVEKGAKMWSRNEWGYGKCEYHKGRDT